MSKSHDRIEGIKGQKLERTVQSLRGSLFRKHWVKTDGYQVNRYRFPTCRFYTITSPDKTQSEQRGNQ